MHFSADISVHRFFQPKPIWLRGYLDVSNTDTKIQLDCLVGPVKLQVSCDAPHSFNRRIAAALSMHESHPSKAYFQCIQDSSSSLIRDANTCTYASVYLNSH